jgi:hypothetical protein
MPVKRTAKGRGSKAKYSTKQQRMADHIEEGYKKSGASEKKAERIAWATVNKTYGGGTKGGSGRAAKAKAARPSATRKKSTRKTKRS